MPSEASKTRAIWPQGFIETYLKGDGIDIGCGPDPILPGVMPFDQAQGDANKVTDFVSRQFDFVFSSHTLEHMQNPSAALNNWWQLVKPGGHMVVLVPDEDLYEQGTFPSLFNRDHKFTFTIHKNKSWSDKSVNVLDLAKELQDAKLIQVDLQDHGYDRKLYKHAAGQWARKFGRMARRLARKHPHKENLIYKVFRFFGAVIDQTDALSPRLAQIQFVLRKATNGSV